MPTIWFFNLDDKSAGIPRKLAEGSHSRIFFGEQVMVSLVEFAPLQNERCIIIPRSNGVFC